MRDKPVFIVLHPAVRIDSAQLLRDFFKPTK